MNYALVIVAFVFLVSSIYWFVHGRHYYTGPRTHARIVGGMIVTADQQAVGGIDVVDQEKATREVLAR
jgi:hypothetical protein